MGEVVEYFKAKDGLTLIDDEVANPCGLIAKSYFYDTFELYEDEAMSK